ncbi:carbamoyl-phosphate synthase domain-containing protein, partial [Xanthomonas citri]
SQVALPEWLQARGVVAISGIDTRKLTRLLRQKGAQNGALMAGDIDVEKALEAARKFPGLKGMDLAKVVSTESTYNWKEGSLDLNSDSFLGLGALNIGKSAHASAGSGEELAFKVVAYDYGVKL